ncbi:hypothetical protein AB1Y20_005700 [Prymnesium parvum]|uniref:Uncharacterized protein n=1 Tax=Prymnesium parvum TaxID=97485 RepID=A0AB34IZK7_PRYPA
MEHVSSSFDNVTQQLSSLARSTELRRAEPARALAAVDAADKQQQSRFSRQRQPGPGQRRWRLTDKPATQWASIPDELKESRCICVPTASPRRSKEEWEAHGETQCGLCGPQCDHWWSSGAGRFSNPNAVGARLCQS